MYEFGRTIFDQKKGYLADLQSFFQAHGFEVGGGWEYDHGFFDKELASQPAYLMLRIPVFAIEGTLDDNKAKVRLGDPFLLKHQYEEGLDHNASPGVWIQPLIDQFSSPKNEDAPLQETDIQVGEKYVRQLEEEFNKSFHKK